MDFSLFLPPSYRPPSVAVCSRSTLLYHLLPTSSPGIGRRPPGRRPHPSLVSLCRSSLRLAPHSCIYRRSLSVCPPFAALGLHPAPWHPPGVRPSSSLRILFLLLLHPLCCTASWNLLLFGFLNGCPFSHKGEGSGRLNSLVVSFSCPRPPATWPRQRRLATLPPSPSPPYFLDPIPTGN